MNYIKINKRNFNELLPKGAIAYKSVEAIKKATALDIISDAEVEVVDRLIDLATVKILRIAPDLSWPKPEQYTKEFLTDGSWWVKQES